jgi:hypothetical protein
VLIVVVRRSRREIFSRAFLILICLYFPNAMQGRADPRRLQGYYIRKSAADAGVAGVLTEDEAPHIVTNPPKRQLATVSKEGDWAKRDSGFSEMRVASVAK